MVEVFARGAAYAASRISSTLKGSTKQFGWLQASTTKRVFGLQTFEATLCGGFAARFGYVGTLIDTRAVSNSETLTILSRREAHDAIEDFSKSAMILVANL